MAFASELKRNEVKVHWENPDTFGTSLLALLIDEYGTDAMDWEPETIRLQVSDLCQAEIPQVNMDKLLGLITALTTDLFYTSIESFSHIANALNDSETDFYSWDPVEADEAAWALTEVLLNDPPKSNEKLSDRFSAEVKRYLGVILEDEGITTPPDILGLAVMSPPIQDAGVTFADDPAMFAGFQRLSQQKSQAVVVYLKRRLRALVNQIKILPLQNRDEASWQKFVDHDGFTKTMT